MTDDFLHQPRWLYIGGEDEQIHGPFPSTEMNNWLGGNFFQPNLMLKLIEDHEFYSLEHLVQACENENPFSFPGNSYQAVVTNATIVQHHQRVQSVPISGGYSSLPATPSSTPTPGPGGFMAAGGADAHQFQQQPQPPPPPAGPPMVTFPIQYVRTSMGGQPLHPTQFLMMPPPLPPTIGPNVQQIGAPPLTNGMFRPGPQPPPMFSPPNQPQQPQPSIPVSTISTTNGFLSPAQAAAFHHQLIQQQSQQQQRAPPQPVSIEIGASVRESRILTFS